MLRNKRRPKITTPSNSSFSNCVQDQLFIQPLRAPLETFKSVVYLDEQGRRHGRVSDHLLQRQITSDRQRLKKQPIPHVLATSTLYGIRNPNIAALVRGVPVENDDEDDEGDERADDEIQFIEYKKSAKPATSKASNRRVSTISGKQSVKFDTTPSVNMARLADSHLTELDDIDNVDDENESDDTDEDDDDEDLESSKPVSNPDSNNVLQTEKSVENFSETPSTPKVNPTDTEDEQTDGLKTNSTLDYNRSSQEIQMPPTVEDVHDDDIEQEKQAPEESEGNLSSPEVAQRKKPSANSSEQTNERYQSASSRPKTAGSSRSRATSTSSDDTSALLRSDNDSLANLSDDDLDNQEEQAPVETPVKSEHSSSNVSETLIVVKEERVTPQPPEQLSQRDAKGEYDATQVIQLKESFQPIINEAASYGHLDIVRKLIEGGQSVHTQNLLQRTPLHEACVSGNGQLVSELLNNGALINQRDSQGMTPLHVAAKHGTLKCLRILGEKGCDLNAQDNLGQTAAHYSAMHDHIDAFEYLTKIQHLDLLLGNQASKLPIHYAAKYGSKKVLSYFFEANLPVASMDNHGNLITHEASEYNQLECIKLIWKKNRNLFQLKNHTGRICLHTAALCGSIDVLHWLLELNVFDINQPDNNGYRMAHLAASRGQGECFSCLIIHGAQLDVYTSDRQESVFDISKRSGKNSRIEQACQGRIRCHCCEEKFAKDSFDKAHARNAVEQLIHTQIQRGYHLNIPVNRSITTLSQRNRPTN